MPLVISVLLFLVYYIFDNTGYKMARDGHANVWFGMWLSTFILAPLGIFVTYKAMHDSAVFDPDKIRLFFRKLTRRKEERSLTMKEVIINDVVPEEVLEKIGELSRLYEALRQGMKGKKIWIGRENAALATEMAEKTEEMVDYLHNSRDIKVIDLINRYPIIRPSALTTVRTMKKYIDTCEKLDAILIGAARARKDGEKE